MMTHIGGYPDRYNKRILPMIKKNKPNLFITGHSHILKVMYDKKNKLLHMNPGAINSTIWNNLLIDVSGDYDYTFLNGAEENS